MEWSFSTREVAPRLAWVRSLLLAACLGTMLGSWPLWTNGRPFPVLPIAHWYPILPAPLDRILFLGVLAALAAAWRWYRKGVAIFLIGGLLLVLGDQCRLQPWFYMYWVMLLLTLAPERTALATCRLALATVYLWSGIQKCNPLFHQQVAPWFVQPIATLVSPGTLACLRQAVDAAPVVEILIAVALWLPWVRPVALGLVMTVHGAALLFLGPLGHDQNWIIWPWNLVMPGLAWALFPVSATPGRWRWRWGSGASRIPSAQGVEAPNGEGGLGLTSGRPGRGDGSVRSGAGGGRLRRGAWAFLVAALFASLPALSFVGAWDSYLSFSLYSGHLTQADLFISADLRERLPEAVRHFTPPTPEPYHPQLQGPYVVRVDLWSAAVLSVPPLPESRNYRNIARWMASLAADSNEVRLVVIPRVGPALFYRGSDLRREAGVSLGP